MQHADLDGFQRSFCQEERRAIRLLAPAGSGKTLALLWRCLYQWEIAPAPKPRFLLFTFTRAARDELRDRLNSDKELAQIAGVVRVATLNAWGFRRLKSKAHNLRVVSRKNRYFTVHNVLRPVWLRHERVRTLMTDSRLRSRGANTIIEVMDGLKSLGFRHDVHCHAEEFTKHGEWLRSIGLGSFLGGILKRLDDIEIVSLEGRNAPRNLEQHFLKFWCEATQHLWESANITLEDQKYWAWLDLENSIAAGKYTTGVHRFSHVLVDEFQDINCLDLRLLQAVAAVNKAELTIVGDDDQAIFEWRGASPEFILKPNENIGSGYATHILRRNYRSPRNIVELSQRLIQHNHRRVAKEIEAASDDDARVEVLEMPTVASSIDYVVSEVRSMLADPAIQNVALIGRKRGQIIPYQIAFAGKNMPFYAAEDLHVFLSDAFKELKDILAIKLRSGLGPIPGFDPVQDLLKLCDKVKRYPLKKDHRASLLSHLRGEGPGTLADAVSSLRRYSGPLKGKNEDARMSADFADAIQSLLAAQTVAAAIGAMSDHFDGMQKDYGKALEDIFYTDPPFIYLRDFAHRYASDYMSFITDLDKAVETLARIPGNGDDEAATQDWKLPLHLTTALRAKGKEFDAVILLDVNDDVWPSKRATSEAELEQERRVFYVALTRARKRLIMLVNDRILDSAATPSPYLAEMGLVPARARAVA